MSWNLSYEYENGDISDDTDQAVRDFVKKVEQPDQPVGVAEQALVAVSHADAIVLSGVVGDPNGKFRFVVSGHSNPEPKPAAGWANDALTINIYQL
jgi:hypothetical protein